jgi:hypothetical protein
VISFSVYIGGFLWYRELPLTEPCVAYRVAQKEYFKNNGKNERQNGFE